MAQRPLQWVNTPVLIQAIERYEQGMLSRPMQLWLEQVLELQSPARSPLRPRMRRQAIAAP